MTTPHRPLSAIALDIRADYQAKGKPVHPYAEPYVTAMLSLDQITDVYFQDSADSIVRYGISNLSSWRGDKAREVKAELKTILASNK